MTSIHPLVFRDSVRDALAIGTDALSRQRMNIKDPSALEAYIAEVRSKPLMQALPLYSDYRFSEDFSRSEAVAFSRLSAADWLALLESRTILPSDATNSSANGLVSLSFERTMVWVQNLKKMFFREFRYEGTPIHLYEGLAQFIDKWTYQIPHNEPYWFLELARVLPPDFRRNVYWNYLHQLEKSDHGRVRVEKRASTILSNFFRLFMSQFEDWILRRPEFRSHFRPDGQEILRFSSLTPEMAKKNFFDTFFEYVARLPSLSKAFNVHESGSVTASLIFESYLQSMLGRGDPLGQLDSLFGWPLDQEENPQVIFFHALGELVLDGVNRGAITLEEAHRIVGYLRIIQQRSDFSTSDLTPKRLTKFEWLEINHAARESREKLEVGLGVYERSSVCESALLTEGSAVGQGTADPR